MRVLLRGCVQVFARFNSPDQVGHESDGVILQGAPPAGLGCVWPGPLAVRAPMQLRIRQKRPSLAKRELLFFGLPIHYRVGRNA